MQKESRGGGPREDCRHEFHVILTSIGPRDRLICYVCSFFLSTVIHIPYELPRPPLLNTPLNYFPVTQEPDWLASSNWLQVNAISS